MLQIQWLRENRTKVTEALAKRGLTDMSILDAALSADEDRRSLQLSHDTALQKLNKQSKAIGALMAQGKKEEAESAKKEVGVLKEQAKALEESLKDAVARLESALLSIPNTPHTLVAEGRSAEDNTLIRSGGELPAPGSKPQPHWELTEEYKLIDFEAGNKLTGSGFPVYTGQGAALQRGLIRYFLEQATQAGYAEVIPPLLVNEASAKATGQLPDKEGQMYHVQDDDLYLIPTAEVPVTNLFRDEILMESSLPRKVVAYTPCFRREAGSYGKDVRGLNRLHQFDKVEIVQVSHPDHSYDVLEEMVQYVETLVKSLELPYRIVRLCGGDMGFTSAMTYDFEVYAAGQDKWLEVSSVSNFETFQSNRLKLRYRREDGKPALAHTLNGSALALPRIVAALLENGQSDEGIRLPHPLAAACGFDHIRRG